ncbi:MAG TPA: hypothetical protein VGO50_08510 [Pyrinomonadaceae bacterium]|nr:hypothetical protein [Pyrinomonadaceae bacterium]
MHFSFKGFIFNLLLVLSVLLPAGVLAQQPPPAATPVPTPSPQEKPAKPDKNAAAKQQQFTPEQLAEAVVIVYGGRAFQTQVGRTTLEHGNMSVTNADGTVDNAKYEKRIIRGENIEKDKWRIDQKFPSVEFALVYNSKIFGLLNDSVFTPRADAVSSFESQMYHGLDALLRFKENGSKVELGEKQKNLGVEYYTLDLIDKNERKTRYLISIKLLRVMSLEYTENSVKYVRKFSDYRYAQGLLVPYKTWLFANDKQVEESLISTVTYGQKVEESYFAES